MALLVMVSTMSFSVDKHFCGSELVDFGIFSKAMTCTSEIKICGVEMDHKMDHEMVADEKDSCCTNQKMALNGQDELNISFHFLDFDQQLFFTTSTYSFIYKYESSSLTEIPFRYYTPPLLVADIQVLDQVFLI
ncbi:MAG: hypothetical protein GZ087_07455 [Flavobacterium sp.]|nr:hypothetical protein [Flavobacterium sp.]